MIKCDNKGFLFDLAQRSSKAPLASQKRHLVYHLNPDKIYKSQDRMEKEKIFLKETTHYKVMCAVRCYLSININFFSTTAK